MTFRNQNGDTPTTLTVNLEDLAEAPAAPTRAGFSFVGWFDEPTGGTVWQPEATTVVPAALYAQWEETVASHEASVAPAAQPHSLWAALAGFTHSIWGTIAAVLWLGFAGFSAVLWLRRRTRRNAQ